MDIKVGQSYVVYKSIGFQDFDTDMPIGTVFTLTEVKPMLMWDKRVKKKNDTYWTCNSKGFFLAHFRLSKEHNIKNLLKKIDDAL